MLAKALNVAGLGWDSKSAHSAVYDAEQTADLFCAIVNRWRELHLTQAEADGAVESIFAAAS